MKPKSHSPERERGLSSAELRIIYALSASGGKRWSGLSRETGLSPRWLSLTLDKLTDRKIVQRAESRDVDSGLPAVTYELTGQFRSERQELVRMMTLFGRFSKRETQHLVSAEPFRVMGVMNVYAKLAALARYYHEDELADFLKQYVLQVLKEWFEAHYDPKRMRDIYLGEEKIDLQKTTFEGYLKRLDFDKILAEYERRPRRAE
jgi:DNA-binding HxlR family transcriptional regulator